MSMLGQVSVSQSWHTTDGIAFLTAMCRRSNIFVLDSEASCDSLSVHALILHFFKIHMLRRPRLRKEFR